MKIRDLILESDSFLVYAVGDLREKFVKRVQWRNCFFVKPSKARTVTPEQLVAMLSPSNLL